MNKKLIIILCILMFTTTVFAATPVTVVPAPIQKVLYDNDVAGNSKEYFGWAAIGTATSVAKWKIMRITYATADATDDFTIEWAGGAPTYVSEWDERAISVVYK